MKLDLSPLENAVAQLGESLELYDSDIVRQYPVIRNQMRAGAIQAFEFTYDLSIRMIKRYLEQVAANPSEVDLLDFRNLVRMAGHQGLLSSELDTWMRYRANRGTTPIAGPPAILTTSRGQRGSFRASRSSSKRPAIF